MDLAEYLVRKGVPFRETHHVSGRVVKFAENEGVQMDKLSLKQLQEIDPRFGEDVLKCFDYKKSVEFKKCAGRDE
jgi:argininosuccinate lyase